MTNSAAQIVAQYDTLGLSIDQIAEIEQLTIPAVKVILLANSPKYRMDTQEKPELDFSVDDAELALGVIRRVAQFSEDDNTALKAAMFMRNDKKGRLDIKSGIKRLNINVSVLNDHFQKAAAAISSRITPQPPQQQKVIDI